MADIKEVEKELGGDEISDAEEIEIINNSKDTPKATAATIRDLRFKKKLKIIHAKKEQEDAKKSTKPINPQQG